MCTPHVRHSLARQLCLCQQPLLFTLHLFALASRFTPLVARQRFHICPLFFRRSGRWGFNDRGCRWGLGARSVQGSGDA
jgi:hypothetical protein